MTPIRILAIILIVAGLAGLAYGKFSYTEETHEVKVGRFDLAVKEKRTVNIPLWAGIVAIAVGGLLLVVPKRT